MPQRPKVAKKPSNDPSNSTVPAVPDSKEGENAAGLPQNAPDPEFAAMPFEQAIAELERIVGQMENGSLSLEQSLAAYKRGVALVARCRDNLSSARQQVRILEGDLMKPFDIDDEE